MLKLLIILFLSLNVQANVCNSRGDCFNPQTIKKMKGIFCDSIGQNRAEIQKLYERAINTDNFNLKENYDLINCYKRSYPLNISKTIIMRDMWPGHLTPQLCFASRGTNLNDFKWVKDGLKRRPHWKKYIKTYNFALKSSTNFRKFCNGVYPFDGKFRLKPRVLKGN
jgi:hypothetical protein